MVLRIKQTAFNYKTLSITCNLRWPEEYNSAQMRFILWRHTVACRYIAVQYNMILHTPSPASSGVPFVMFFEKIDRVITAPHCIYMPGIRRMTDVVVSCRFSLEACSQLRPSMPLACILYNVVGDCWSNSTKMGINSNWSLHDFCIDGLVQERCNSIANALELRLSCTNRSICATVPCNPRYDCITTYLVTYSICNCSKFSKLGYTL